MAESGNADRSKARELREVCAQDALKSPDPETRALLLDRGSVEEYATWIRNEFHWGGEAEVDILARHYGIEVALVDCNCLQVRCYGSDNSECKGRSYILYTGQHYDPIVAAASPDVMPADEQRRFLKGDASLDASALELAKKHNEEAARKASQRKAKYIKCCGCNALLPDPVAFEAHCMEVEHDDDFAFDCEEVTIVVEGDEALPEGSVDLNVDSVHSFNNSPLQVLSNHYPESYEFGGKKYHSVEHYWLALPFIGHNDETAAAIAAAPSTEEAAIVAHGAFCSRRPDFREARGPLMLEALRARAAQSAAFKEALLATGDKTIVCVDTDPWAGMQAPGGIATGQNNIGKTMMYIRTELRNAAAAAQQ